jgi:hypothetical protein
MKRRNFRKCIQPADKLALRLTICLLPIYFPYKGITKQNSISTLHMAVLPSVTWIQTIKKKNYTESFKLTEKGKAIPLQAWTGPEGTKMLRITDFKTIGK